MAKPILHIPQKDSPEAFLTISVNTADTILTLSDSSVFSAAGITRLTLGSNTEITETVKVVSYQANNEVIVERGSPAYSWIAETKVMRLLTAQDVTEIHQYLDYLDENLVTNADLHDHAGGDGAQIPTAGIEDLAITNAKLASDSVTGDKIALGAVGADKIAIDAIDTDKVLDAAITNAKLADPYDTLYCVVVDKDTELEALDGLEYFFIPRIHANKIATELWAGIPTENISAANITVRFYDITNAVSLGSVIIPAGSRTATLAISYMINADQRIRVDCIGTGAGVMGLHIQIKVQKT